MPDRGACAGRAYLERGEPVLVERGWRGRHAKRVVLIVRPDGSRDVRPFRGLRLPFDDVICTCDWPTETECPRHG